MRFSGKLSKGFVLGKPIAQAQDSYKESIIKNLEQSGQLMITRKRDGWKMFAAIDGKNKVRLYTDGMNEVDGRFDHIKSEIQFLGLPGKSLVVGEVIWNLDGTDDVTKLQSIFKSSRENALKTQRVQGEATYNIFNLVFKNGQFVDRPYSETFEYLQELVRIANTHFVRMVPLLSVPLGDAKQMVVKNAWEGLVLYDRNFVISFRTDGGNIPRPKGCYKWKPIQEDDFIVRALSIRPGTQLVKEVVLLQIDKSTGKEFECGKLGSFSKKLREELAKITLPLIMQVGFEGRFQKTNTLRNARFMRIRYDKKVKDCIAPQSFG